jgi:hypothetical protein
MEFVEALARIADILPLSPLGYEFLRSDIKKRTFGVYIKLESIFVLIYKNLGKFIYSTLGNK